MPILRNEFSKIVEGPFTMTLIIELTYIILNFMIKRRIKNESKC